jgi:hypothetical protein
MGLDYGAIAGVFGNAAQSSQIEAAGNEPENGDSPEKQARVEKGQKIGSTAGTVIGGVAGFFFGGPAGALLGSQIGGALGGVLGGAIAGWTYDEDNNVEPDQRRANFNEAITRGLEDFRAYVEQNEDIEPEDKERYYEAIEDGSLERLLRAVAAQSNNPELQKDAGADAGALEIVTDYLKNEATEAERQEVNDVVNQGTPTA